MCNIWKFSYTPGKTQYPWTALGYTYDWGSRDFAGPSEYLGASEAPARIHSVTPTAKYCGIGP